MSEEVRLGEPSKCPECDRSFKGDPIPEKDRHWFGDYTHFRTCIGITDGDSVYEWKCPYCQHVWDRFPKI